MALGFKVEGEEFGIGSLWGFSLVLGLRERPASPVSTRVWGSSV